MIDEHRGQRSRRQITYLSLASMSGGIWGVADVNWYHSRRRYARPNIALMLHDEFNINV